MVAHYLEALLPQPKPLNTQWTKQIADPKAKSDFEIIVRNSTLLLTRLKGIIEESEQSLLSQSGSIDDFKDPNWSHKQAFRNGQLSELKKLKSLIPF